MTPLNWILLLVCFCPAPLLAKSTDSGPRLAGILNLPAFKQALVQNADSRPWRQFSLLKEGEREGDLEMLEIHPENGSV